MPKKNVPDVRFPGFEDDWKRRKFGDEMYIKSRVGWQALTKKEYLYQGDYYLITGTDIDEITHTVDLTKSWYVSKDRYDMDENIQVHNGDLIITKDGTIGKVAFVKDLDKPATLNSHLFLVRDLSGTLDSGFLFQILNSWVFQSFIERVKTGSTLTGLPQKTIVEFEFSYPSLEEQRQVSNFLETIDQTIIFHQRKLKEIKKLKNGLLQKMFPQKGEKVPQIRFPEFSDDWEQRKAEDLFESYVDKGHPELPVLSATQEFGMVYRDDTGLEIHHDTSNEAGYKRVLPGQFVIHLRSFQGGFAHSSIEGITSPAYTIFGFKNEDEQNDTFWKYVFSSKAFIKRLETVTYGIRDGRSISYSDFLGLKFRVPSKEEQEKISEFFLQMDETITLHQQKIDDLNRLKAGLLQKMFI